MDVIIKLFRLFNKSQLESCAVIIICMLIGGGLEALGIGAIVPLISIVGQPDILSNNPDVRVCASYLNINTHNEFIIACAILLMVVYYFKNIYIILENKLQINFFIQHQIHFTHNLMAYYLAKPYLFHVDKNSATLLRNINNIGTTVFTSILNSVFILFTESITAIAILITVIIVDPVSSILIFGAFGLVTAFIIRSTRRIITEQGLIRNDYSAEYIKWVNQSLNAIKDIKVMCNERFFLREFFAKYAKYGNAHRKYIFMSRVPRPCMEAIVVTGLLMLIIVKIYFCNNAEDIVPYLALLSVAAFRIMPSINRIVETYNNIRFEQALFLEIYPDLLEIKETNYALEFMESNKIDQPLSFENSISIKDISFSYPGSTRQILKNVSIKIEKGDFVGLIGASGAGKTTFVDILLGILEPSNGTIFVDGVNIFQDITKWRAILAYVPQSIYLIDGSIRDNIAMGVEACEIDDYRLNRAIEMAELDHVIKELPSGILTNVGENGVKLSGGQKQRIGIARALYFSPEVLILDEATSALDDDTEKSITNTILKLKGRITIIAIAHRTSTLEECDYKVLFSNGCISVV